MSSSAGVSLQISMTPSDVRYATYTVPHQLRQWAGQVQDILVTIDAPLPAASTGHPPAWQPGLERFLLQCLSPYPHARFEYVDYSPTTFAEVCSIYYGGRHLPIRDFRDTPIYPYLFALHAARYDRVVHLDADMMFGGGSQIWVAEAERVLTERPDVLTCSPLPGPPTRHGGLRSQAGPQESGLGLAFRFQHMSSRLFMLDRQVLAELMRSQRIQIRRPLRSSLKAISHGRWPYECFEDTVSRMMRERGLFRIDFLGEGPGMWSLHAPTRHERYFELLPELLRAVQAGQIPEVQRGEYDLRDETLDWLASRGAGELAPVDVPPAAGVA
jgi:hypothetical protein